MTTWATTTKKKRNITTNRVSTMQIGNLNHFNIATRSLEASAQFYEKLGLRRGNRPPFSTSGIWMENQCGNPIIHLNDANEVGPIVAGTAAIHHIGLNVHGSVEQITAKLDVLGIKFDLWDPIPGTFRALYFHGPSGESIEFVMIEEFVHHSQSHEVAGLDAGVPVAAE